MEELHEEFDLAAEFEVGRKDGLGVGDVDAIHLGGIDLSFTFMDCRMKADCGEFLREFSFIRAAFAEVEEALVTEFHIVDVADADDTFISSTPSIVNSSVTGCIRPSSRPFSMSAPARNETTASPVESITI